MEITWNGDNLNNAELVKLSGTRVWGRGDIRTIKLISFNKKHTIILQWHK
jgi:hypothetical protein